MVNDKIEVLLNLIIAVEHLSKMELSEFPMYTAGWRDAIDSVLGLINRQVNEIMNDIAVGVEK